MEGVGTGVRPEMSNIHFTVFTSILSSFHIAASTGQGRECVCLYCHKALIITAGIEPHQISMQNSFLSSGLHLCPGTLTWVKGWIENNATSAILSSGYLLLSSLPCQQSFLLLYWAFVHTIWLRSCISSSYISQSHCCVFFKKRCSQTVQINRKPQTPCSHL